jgi:putative hemolysin
MDTARTSDAEAIGEDLNAADNRTSGRGNPSWQYCEQGGGTVEGVSNSIGIPIGGICQFTDGTECETWAYARNECNPGDCTKWDSEANSCGIPSDAGTTVDRPVLEPDPTRVFILDARVADER